MQWLGIYVALRPGHTPCELQLLVHKAAGGTVKKIVAGLTPCYTVIAAYNPTM